MVEDQSCKQAMETRAGKKVDRRSSHDVKLM